MGGVQTVRIMGTLNLIEVGSRSSTEEGGWSVPILSNQLRPRGLKRH
jgi:hypothetical protein